VVEYKFDQLKKLVQTVTFVNKVLADGEVPTIQYKALKDGIVAKDILETNLRENLETEHLDYV